MKKLPAGSLLLAIFLSFIIALFLGLVLLRLSYFSSISARIHSKENCQDYFTSAIAATLADPNVSTHQYQGDLLGDFSGNAQINIINWGIFPIASVTANVGRDTLSRSFMMGRMPDSILNACIYLEEHNKPLLISGNTLLNGDVYLPKNGISPTYLDKTGYTREKLFNGQKYTSTLMLRDILNREILRELTSLSTGKHTSSLTGNNIHQSFADSLLSINVLNNISSGDNYSGHIIIRSDSMLTVPMGCTLNNVILIAPYIKFEKGFKGKLQAIATDSIVTGEDCIFDYPSAFILLKNTRIFNNVAVIRLGKGAKITGCILGYCDNAKDEMKIYTELCHDSKVTGVVFNDGFLELNGQVTGTVLAGSTLLKNGASIYDNQLHNVTIDRIALSSHYLAPPLLFNTPAVKKILQWLD